MAWGKACWHFGLPWGQIVRPWSRPGGGSGVAWRVDWRLAGAARGSLWDPWGSVLKRHYCLWYNHYVCGDASP